MLEGLGSPPSFPTPGLESGGSMSNAKSVLILGGTRYFGYHIARSLIAEGHQVTVYSRGMSRLFPEGAEHVVGDRNDRGAFREAFIDRQFDVVIDMIAYHGSDSQAVVDVFRESVGHLVHISTASVYAVLDDPPSPLREPDYAGTVRKPAKPSRGHEYGMGKRECEDVLWKAHADSGLPVTTLRLPIVLGEGDYTLRAQSYLLRIMDGEPVILPGGGLNPMSFVYQADVVDFVTDNLGNDAIIGQALNLAQDEIPTVRMFVDMAAEVLGQNPDLVEIPSPLLKRSGYKFSGSPFTSKRPFIIANDKAKQLGFVATPMVEWLARTVRYFNADGPGEIPEEYANREAELRIIDAWRAVEERFGELVEGDGEIDEDD